MIEIERRSRWMTASVSTFLGGPPCLFWARCKRPVSELFPPITDLLVVVAFIEAIMNVPT